MAQNVRNGDLCIVCNVVNLTKWKSRTNPARKPRKHTKSTAILKQRLKGEEDFAIFPQLRPLFLLKEIFKYPIEDTCNLLRSMGNPSEWFEICSRCCNQIDQGIEIQGKLRRLEQRFVKVKEGLYDKLHTSRLQENVGYGESEALGVGDARSVFRTELRKTIRTTSNTSTAPVLTTESPVLIEQLAPEVKTEEAFFDAEVDDAGEESHFEPENVVGTEDESDHEEPASVHRWNSFLMVEMDAEMTNSDTVSNIVNQNVLTPIVEDGSIERIDVTALNPQTYQVAAPGSLPMVRTWNVPTMKLPTLNSHTHEDHVVASNSQARSRPKKKAMKKLLKRVKYNDNVLKPNPPSKRKRKARMWYYKPITENRNKPDPSDGVSEPRSNKDKPELNVTDHMHLHGRTLRKRTRTKLKFIFDEDENDDELDEDFTIEEEDLEDDDEQEDAGDEEEDGEEDFDDLKLEKSVHTRVNLDRCKSSVKKAKDLIRNGPPSVTTSNIGNRNASRWERLLNFGNEFLDMSLVTYPPRTEEERLKIPKKLSKRETGSVRNENGATNIPTDDSCPSCGKYFTHKYFAISHIHRFHLGIRKHWTCNQCSKKFSDARRLVEHLQLHDAGIILCCPVCKSYRTWSQRKLDYHIACHQKDVSNPICDPCGKIFSDFKMYMHHVWVKHGIMGNKKSIVCELCSKTIGSKRSFKFHQVQHHGLADEEGIFPICSHCGKLCRSANDLDCHIQRDHIKATNFFCDQCGSGFALESQLKYHIDHIHTETTPTPKICHVCNFVVPNAKGFRRHMTKHHPEAINMSDDELEAHKKKLNEEKSHKCTLCNKSFAFSVFLYHHYRKEHPEVTDKFRCEVCGKGYSRACSVKRHYESVHEKNMVLCQYCNKEFPLSTMYQHQQSKSCIAKRKAETDAKISCASGGEHPITSGICTFTSSAGPAPVTTSLFTGLEPSCSRTKQQQFENLNETTDILYTNLV